MTPAAYILGLINDNIDSIDHLSSEHVHAFMIDPSDNTTTELILVVSELTDDGSDYGNDTEINIIRQVQLTFYYPPDYQYDMTAIEKGVKRVLFSKNIRCFSDAGHVMTPDNQNITNTLKFKYKEES